MEGEKHDIEGVPQRDVDVVRNPFKRALKRHRLRGLEETVGDTREAESAAVTTRENIDMWSRQDPHHADEHALDAAAKAAIEATARREGVEKEILRLRAELGLMAAKEESRPSKTLEEKLAPYKVGQHEEPPSVPNDTEEEQKAA